MQELCDHLDAAVVQAVGRLGSLKRAVLAVSGGPDSLALLLAAAEAKKTARLGGIDFHVVTVDHGLRPESAGEADFVADIARALGLHHKTRRWAQPAHTGNIPAAARRARYALLLDAARQVGATAILTAHHQDDQFETHLLARARGAGDTGLAGMRAVRDIAPGMVLVRPFLAVRSCRLKAMVAAEGIPAVDDPTNADEAYRRVQLRRQLAGGDIDRRRLRVEIAGHAERRDAAEARLADVIGAMEAEGGLVAGDEGTLIIDRGAVAALERSTAFLLMRRAIDAVAGREYAPGGQSVMRVVDAITTRKGRAAMSLGGVLIDAGPRIELVREFGRAGIPGLERKDFASHVVFDGRFDVHLSRYRRLQGGRLVAFGSTGRGNRIERTLPVLVADGRLVAAPAMLARKIAADIDRLDLRSRIGWRLTRDLPSPATAAGRFQ